jgi:hypothetical protein|tara:strand:+ start:495 stop:662 length:168 start_codon:yes stop_codon:yes gene_type:complete
MPDNRTQVEHKVCELMNGGVLFLETPNDGATYVYTHEDIEYNFIFDTDHWKFIQA